MSNYFDKDENRISKKRFTAFWERDVFDRPIVQVYAPKESSEMIEFNELPGWDFIYKYLDNPLKIIENCKKSCNKIYFGGEEYPNLWLNMGAGVLSAFMGSEPVVKPETVWFETKSDWEFIENMDFDPENKWFLKAKEILSLYVEKCDGNYIPGMTDIGGIMDIAASLRGTQNLLFDLIDEPDRVMNLLKKITDCWIKCYDELHRIISRKITGSSAWMGIWCPERWYPVQCDFSSMISPEMFKRFVVPSLEMQCEHLDYTIYHLDGPQALVHLEMLLDLPFIDGIQWEPGAGNPSTSSDCWFDIYKKIQKKGKCLVLRWLSTGNLKKLLSEISPEGLLLHFGMSRTVEEAEKIIEDVKVAYS